jgi:hypothetical protein
MFGLTNTQLAQAVFHPHLWFLSVLRMLPVEWFFEWRVLLDGVERPYYAYGILNAAVEAQRLGIGRISVIEFGVAGGHGLLLIEKYAEQAARITGVKIDVYGFDLETGLPQPSDYRDLPYVWKKGFYQMDKEALMRKIKASTKLVLGDVAKNVPKFMKTKFAPIGFISFDLDFYSSTADALKILTVPADKILPRAFCYFDDVVGNEEEYLCDDVGELLAINEFNAKQAKRKLAPIQSLRLNRVFKATWNHMVYVAHAFDHPKYNTFIYSHADRQIVLDQNNQT